MLVVAGSVTIDASKREEAIGLAQRMMEETRKEPGNLAYTFSADLADSAVFHIFEEWESQDSLDAHFASPHMARFQQGLGGLGVKDLTVRKFEISSVGPLR